MEREIRELNDAPELDAGSPGAGTGSGSSKKECVCATCPHNKKGINSTEIAIKVGIFIVGLILGLVL